MLTNIITTVTFSQYGEIKKATYYGEKTAAISTIKRLYGANVIDATERVSDGCSPKGNYSLS